MTFGPEKITAFPVIQTQAGAVSILSDINVMTLNESMSAWPIPTKTEPVDQIVFIILSAHLLSPYIRSDYREKMCLNFKSMTIRSDVV